MMQIAGVAALCLWAFMALVSLALTLRFVVIMTVVGVMTLREFRTAKPQPDPLHPHP